MIVPSVSKLRMLRLLRLVILAATLILSAAPLQAQRSTKPPRSVTAPTRPVAVVNGQQIPYERYTSLYNDQLSYQHRLGMADTVDQNTDDLLMLRLVDAELIRQEAAKRGITVTRNEAVKSLLRDPPDFIREPFIDGSGKFHDDIFKQVVLHPEAIARMSRPGVGTDSIIARWKADLEKVVIFMQEQEVQRRLVDKLYGNKPLTPAKIRARYFTENTRFTGSFIRILHSTIPDSLVPVTEEEARRWYDSHLEDYRFGSARQLASIILPVVPLAKDSAAQRARIAEVRDRVLNVPTAQREKAINDLARSLPPNRMPEKAINLLQVPEAARDPLRKSKPGDLIGPFRIGNEDVLIFVEDTITTRDTLLRARHVLVKVPPTDTAEDRATRDLLTALKEKITNEDMFLQAVKFYSQDGSVSRQGDLGFFGHGGMVKEFEEAAFNGPTGKVIGPVHSQFGYHLIWVNERVTTGYRIRELRFPFGASADAMEAARRDAMAYAAEIRAGKATDSSFFALKARYPRTVNDTSLVRRLDAYGDALAAVNFAFNAEVGDVAVLTLPFDRLLITRVIYSYPTGIAPYDKIHLNFVYPHVRRARQLVMLKPRVEALRDTITADMLLGIIRLKAPWAESFMAQNQFLTSPPDEDTTLIDSLMEVTHDNGVGGPVMGKHGYYFLRVVAKHDPPTSAEYERNKAAFTASYTERYRKRLLADLLFKMREYTTFEDLRTNSVSTAGIPGVRPPGNGN